MNTTVITMDNMEEIFGKIAYRKIGRLVSVGEGEEALRLYWLSLIGDYELIDDSRVYRNRNDLINTIIVQMLPLFENGQLELTEDAYKRICRIVYAYLYKEGLVSYKSNLRRHESLDSLVNYVGAVDAEDKQYINATLWSEQDALTATLRKIADLITASGYKQADRLLQILPYIGNQSVREISNIIGISKSSVDRRISKIRKILADNGYISSKDFK